MKFNFDMKNKKVGLEADVEKIVEKGMDQKEKDWKDYLVQADYRQKAEQTKKEIALLGEEYEKKARKQYEEALRTEIAGLAGAKPERCTVRIREGEVRSIRIKVEKMPDSLDSVITSLSLRYGVEKDNIFIEEG